MQSRSGYKELSCRILIVEDMATNRMMLRQLLQPPEFDVIEADNGRMAIEMLRTQEVDTVLMDIMMPELNGIEATKIIRQDLMLSLLPIIMLTSLSEPDSVMQALAAGADDYITKPFNVVELLARVRAAVQRKRLTEHLDDTESVLYSLARMVEARDANTGNHCERLAHYGYVFGEYLQLGHEDLLALRRGGVMHDIGKLGIPDSILLKKGGFTAEEWEIMKQHTIIGARLCSPLKTMARTVDIILNHHEKQDGSGYPRGLKGKEIPLLARIFQIVDIFDALSNKRPYKPAFPRAQVIKILREETDKGFWDPELMDAFVTLLYENPEAFSQESVQASAEKQADSLLALMNDRGVLEWYR